MVVLWSWVSSWVLDPLHSKIQNWKHLIGQMQVQTQCAAFYWTFAASYAGNITHTCSCKRIFRHELAAQRRTRCLPPGEGPPRVRTPPGEQVNNLNKCYNIQHTYNIQTHITTYRRCLALPASWKSLSPAFSQGQFYKTKCLCMYLLPTSELGKFVQHMGQKPSILSVSWCISVVSYTYI